MRTETRRSDYAAQIEKIKAICAEEKRSGVTVLAMGLESPHDYFDNFFIIRPDGTCRRVGWYGSRLEWDRVFPSYGKALEWDAL